MKKSTPILIILVLVLIGCTSREEDRSEHYQSLISQYDAVELTADLSHLTESEKQMIPLLMEAADIIDDIFWLQSYGPKEHLMEQMQNPYAREYALINYGPWGRLEGHTAFYPGFDDKPLGARFYPADMSREEFDSWDNPDKSKPNTLVSRDKEGNLIVIPYTQAYANKNEEIAELLIKAAQKADYQPFANYLEKLSEAIVSGDFRESDFAWMEMKDNNIELVLRPLDTGEDRKFGYKAAHSSYIMVKDLEWSKRLERFAGMAANLFTRLPVADEYKQEMPANDSEILVYDALYYAGHCNAGPKIIALYLPRDSDVTAVTGTRSMQLKNVMEAKFSKILLPIAQMMIDERQQQYISSDAFFLLTAFHEIAAALGITQTIDGNSTVSAALREHHGTIDATVTDLMALYLIAQLYEMGEITENELREAYVTSFASVMRSSRFGTAGAHGVAGMIRFNYFENENVFTRDQNNQSYHVDVDNMRQVVEKALKELLIIQGNGNYHDAEKIVKNMGTMPQTLKNDIERINNAGIPVDVYFRQGAESTGI